MQTIQQVTNQARYVEWLNNWTFAVWHGGHTVNFYSFEPETSTVQPTTTLSVGNYETGEVSLEDVKSGINSIKEENEY